MGTKYRNFRTFVCAFATLAATVVAALSAPLVAGGDPVITADITIGADDSPVDYGDSVTISGRLKNTTLKSGVVLSLEAKPAPFTGDYETIATTQSSRNGHYVFAHVVPTEHTRYRVTSTVPQGTSDEVLVEVRIKVALRLSDKTPHKGENIRFYGTASPEHDGRTVYIQRRSFTGRWHSVKKTVLKDAGTELSRFSKHYRVRRDGSFRARVFHDSDHADGTSGTKHANVVRGG
jgi:hypothetical protein